MNQTKPLFITLEGGEGVGKTTNIAVITRYFEQRGIPFITTREPGGTELAESIRHLVLTKNGRENWCEMAELLLIFAARAQHLQQLIQPALAAGKTVLCDRFTDATYAYQGRGRGLNKASISTLENLVQGQLRPDLTLLLDAPAAVGMARASQRAELDRFESEQTAFFEAVRAGYLQQAQQHPQRFRIIDASASIDAVEQQLLGCLEEWFSRG